MPSTLLSAIFVFCAVTSAAALSIVAFDVAEKDRRDSPCMGAKCDGRRELVTFDVTEKDRRDGPYMGAACGGGR
ncbi:hypothetical protein C8J57DRAFT_1524020 [Mycena rebaudengoi]|nr:hypothetical protein C8J57DRAFT_1524020 [Mycena rebaudengoi]